MPELIYETVVTTCAADGRAHVAPMGVRHVGDDVVLMPFKPSTTLDNVLATRTAVLNVVDDVRVFAGCVTGRRDWPLVALPELPGVRLAAALAHTALRLVAQADDAQRPRLTLAPAGSVQHAPWRGFNRAQSAVVEGAILVSRLRMLTPQKIDDELRYLQIAIDKTAGPRELEAWDWLLQAVARHRAAAGAAEGAR